MTSGLFSLPIARLRAADDAARDAWTEPQNFFSETENALVRSLLRAACSEVLPYNPLVVCGGPGIGKSALAETLAARRSEQLNLRNVVATSGADLPIILGHSLESGGASDLRSRFHRCDILLVDDAHRLTGKAAAQQFLLTAIDSLIHRGSLVIVSLRRHPQATVGLLPQLISRFAGGLVVKLAMPGPLARQEIVRQAAARAGLRLSPEETMHLAGDGAGRYATPAKLRRAVLQLAAAAEFQSNADTANAAAPLSAHSPDATAVARAVMIAVAKHFGLAIGELKGKSRQQTIAEARGLAMYLVRRLTSASYAEIGRFFGNRDHTTALHACRKTAAAIANDPFQSQIAEDMAMQIAAEGVH